MSNILRKNKREINKAANKRKGDRINLTNTLYGSLFQTFLLCAEKEISDADFIRYFKEHEFPTLDDETLLDTLYEEYTKEMNRLGAEYDVDYYKQCPICISISEYNMIASPYIVKHYEDDEGNELPDIFICPLPLIEDDILKMTQRLAVENETVKIIDWD